MTKKEIRQLIYNKYGGKCAYCGQDLPNKWHIDHFLPVVRNWWENTYNNPENNNIDNYMPSCPSCNILKSSFGIEMFRKGIQGYINSLTQYSTQYKMAKKFGLVQETGIEVKFYFEIYGNK